MSNHINADRMEFSTLAQTRAPKCSSFTLGFATRFSGAPLCAYEKAIMLAQYVLTFTDVPTARVGAWVAFGINK